ncbi:MAG: hypothetical protein CJD30_10465, partial [Sulfuricurvum sp. PD_MW2]|uniref:hypothetical protein n=1 Tax=Sulfuricurvum sp. PD_MW2 TaxID=2027917 RepID=UPI000C05FCB6
NNLHRLDFLQEKRELSTDEKEERNLLQTIVQNKQEKLTSLNNATRILFIGSVENYADFQFGTSGGERALNGILKKFNSSRIGINGKTKIDVWKDKFFVSMHLSDEELKEVLNRLNLNAKNDLTMQSYYLDRLSDEIRIGMAMPSIALELWYQINIRGHDEKNVMKSFNPSGWEFGLG